MKIGKEIKILILRDWLKRSSTSYLAYENYPFVLVLVNRLNLQTCDVQ